MNAHVGVGLDVGEQIKEGAGSLDGPSDLVTRGLVSLANSMSANTTSVLGERNSFLELEDILEVSLSLANGAALDGLTNLTAVLEVNSDVSSTGLGGY